MTLPLYRIPEIIFYSILNLLPYLSLALYPFRDNLRYSRAAILLQIALITLLQIALGLLAASLPAAEKGIISAFSTFIYFVFYFLAVRAHPGKILFTLLMLSNIANLLTVTSKCMEGLLFPALAAQSYRWSFSVILMAQQLLLLIPLFFYMQRIYTNAIKKDTASSVWRYLWLIPATFYLLWFYHLYNNAQTALEVSLKPANALFLLCINLGAFLIYSLVARLINEYDKNARLEQQNHILTLENLQYENLTDKIMEARQARHDLRHHITVMTEYLNAKDFHKLESYLMEYRSSLPEDSSIVFCQNQTVNLLLLHFAQQARDNQIDFTVYADIPEELKIPQNDLAVILGNLLENAVDACCSQKNSHKRIVFRGRMEHHSLLLTVDNTFEGQIKRDKNGTIQSSKHPGFGLGLTSVEHIAKRYEGMLKVQEKEGIFYASVLLHVPKPTTPQQCPPGMLPKAPPAPGCSPESPSPHRCPPRSFASAPAAPPPRGNEYRSRPSPPSPLTQRAHELPAEARRSCK